MTRARDHAAALARRLGADLADLRELAELEPGLAESIRAALTAQLAAWPPLVSLSEKALGS